MALTKVTGSVIKDSVSLSGNVSVGGTLTYQDVTNVDALGIGTFRTGIKVLAGQVDVGSNIKLGNAGVITATSFSGVMSGTTGSFSGQVNVGSNIKLGTAGVVTATSFVGSGANLTNLDASDLASGTVPTARLGSGTASSSTFLAGDSTYKTVTGTTINNNADNRLITGSGTANTLEGESTLTYNAGGMNIYGDSDRDGIKITQSGNNYGEFNFNSNRSAADNALGIIRAEWNSSEVASIYLTAGDDTSNKDDGKIKFFTSASGGSITNRMEILNNGNVKVTDGDLVIGTSGHGIDFSANSHASAMSSELLDYYEEGSWTPTFNSNSNGGTFPVSTYIRIGRLVSISFHATVGGGNDTSGFKVFGLPFNPDKNGVAPVSTNCNIPCHCRIFDSSNRMEVHKFDSSDVTYQNLSDKFIMINATYRCNP